MSAADLALYTAFGYNAIPAVTGTDAAASPAERLLDMMASSPVILQATQLAVDIVCNTTVDISGETPAMEELVPGMNTPRPSGSTITTPGVITAVSL